MAIDAEYTMTMPHSTKAMTTQIKVWSTPIMREPWPRAREAKS
jgi:hypothetical protein